MSDIVTQRGTGMLGNTLMVEPAASTHRQGSIKLLNIIGRHLLTCTRTRIGISTFSVL